MSEEAIQDPREYAELTHLPLFRQTVREATPLPATLEPQLPSTPSPILDVDWSLVATLRAQASEQLSQAVAADRGRLDRAAQQELGRSIVLDLVEAATLQGRTGERFAGVVVGAAHDDPRRGEAVVRDPAVEARVRGEQPLPVGEDVELVLAEADPDTRRVSFTL